MAAPFFLDAELVKIGLKKAKKKPLSVRTRVSSIQAYYYFYGPPCLLGWSLSCSCWRLYDPEVSDDIQQHWL